MSVKSRIGRRS